MLDDFAPVVDGGFGFWDSMSDDERQSWFSNDYDEAGYFDMWSELDSNFNPSTAR